MPLQDTDILLVNRNGDSFRETFANLRAAVPDGTVTEVTGTAPIQVANGTTTPVVSVLTGTTGRTGVVQLEDSTSSTSTTTAATPNSVRLAMESAGAANTNANNRVAKAGDTMTGRLAITQRTITSGTAWDSATGNYWTFAGGTIANPTNQTAGTCGLIVCTGAVTGWGSNFNSVDVSTVPAVVPYYIQASGTIRVGQPVEVG